MPDPLKHTIKLPPGLEDDTLTPEAVRAALRELRELSTRHRDADRAAVRARADLERAEEEQVAAEAAALRSGDKSPPTTALAKQRSAVERDERDVQVLAAAVRQAYSALVAAIEQAQQGWATALHERSVDARDELVAAVNTVISRDATLKRALVTEIWLSGGGVNGGRLIAPRVGTPSLQRPSGDPYAIGDILAAVADYAAGGNPPALERAAAARRETEQADREARARRLAEEGRHDVIRAHGLEDALNEPVTR